MPPPTETNPDTAPSPVILTSDKLLRPTWAEIDCAAMRRNYARLRDLAGDRKMLAVVKADAYGHGATITAKLLDACGADWFGVATVEEGIELRAVGIQKPILLLGGLYMSDPADLVEYQLTPSVSSTARLDTYAECARRSGKPIDFHLKIDTGLGRLGMPPELLKTFLEHLQRLNGNKQSGRDALRLTGVFTHLACAEDLVATQTHEQVSRFRLALACMQSLGSTPEWVHISNSAALLAHLDVAENLVRVGALLYGYCLPLLIPPGISLPPLPVFEPVLSFKTRVVFLKDQPVGAPIGYGASYYTRRPSRIATLPVGYADGLNRARSNRGRVLVRGSYARIVGNISMDLTLIDVTDIPNVSVGDEVTLIGKVDDCSITAAEVARELGTIPYEILCAIGKRVPRIYLSSADAENVSPSPDCARKSSGKSLR
ncbi:MAG TPA: alanine racemase [Terriglobia bacterium]|nr:alanine racemase [Terriglobia bacterium]